MGHGDRADRPPCCVCPRECRRMMQPDGHPNLPENPPALCALSLHGDDNMTDTNPIASRRNFIKTTGHGSRGLGPGGRGGPGGACRRKQHDPARPGRLRRPRHRRVQRTPCRRPSKARSSSWPWPTSSRIGSASATTTLTKEHGDKVDVPEDRKFIGFDGYQKAMDCLQAGRRGDPRHAAGLPLGPLHLRHREGPQRLHGEADHGRRPDAPAGCSPWARRPRRRTSRWASA